ncbi:SGNH/GDSL hydrolase family protein [Rhodopirellula sallentina]|uniref:Membrane-bound dehydrogenase domain-containing protein n=1 Tax=Rhodopirellula sallentina SM41 TaxID=1263870 RepID=M5UBX7_9BACT|nr:SGNH/GDSL hydrolase family protein [Rhodopirellula sallentina]EMI53508.1 membrane-bound dehydrogenase domain-containing protein [Rhodopirellula sallentina SM41]
MRSIYPVFAVLLLFATTSPLLADSPIRPGDRIAVVGNTFADQLRIHGYLETLLLQRTAERPVSIRNLGWGGDMLTARDRPTNFPSEAETLRQHQTDVIIACFGMGESFAGEGGLENFEADVAAWISSHRGRSYNGNSDVRLILVSPIACEDHGSLTPKRDARNDDLQSYSNAMREVARESDVLFVDLFETSRYLMDESLGPNLTINGVHLNEYGYWAISHTFANQLFPDQDVLEPWRIRLDVGDLSASASGVSVSSVSADEKGIRFDVKEDTFPRLPPPVDSPLPPQLEFRRDTLAVENLSPGTYELTVDGAFVVSATATEWAKGVAIDSTPAHRDALSVRAAVNDKNLQFTYSWKALNQVHIVGERRSSPSGKALPAEVIRFREIADQRDLVLSKALKRSTRRWRLARVEDE